MELLSGSAAAVVSRLVVAPLDVLKIRMQLSGVEGGCCSPPPSLASLLRRMLREEGWSSLWKGNVAAEAMVVPYGAVSFLAYQWSAEQLTAAALLLPPPLHLPPSLVPLLSGASAGVAATVVTYPLDLLRTRFAAQHSQRRRYAHLRHAVRSIASEEGWRGFYRGLWPTLVGIVPMMAVQFQAYETAKRWLLAYNRRRPTETPSDDGKLSSWQRSGAGFVAGLLSKLLTMPLDVVKKRVQVRHFDFAAPSSPPPTSPCSTLRPSAAACGARGGGSGARRDWWASTGEVSPHSSKSLRPTLLALPAPPLCSDTHCPLCRPAFLSSSNQAGPNAAVIYGVYEATKGPPPESRRQPSRSAPHPALTATVRYTLVYLLYAVVPPPVGLQRR